MECEFSAQTWRKEICVHCFQPRSAHTRFEQEKNNNPAPPRKEPPKLFNLSKKTSQATISTNQQVLPDEEQLPLSTSSPSMITDGSQSPNHLTDTVDDASTSTSTSTSSPNLNIRSSFTDAPLDEPETFSDDKQKAVNYENYNIETEDHMNEIEITFESTKNEIEDEREDETGERQKEKEKEKEKENEHDQEVDNVEDNTLLRNTNSRPSSVDFNPSVEDSVEVSSPSESSASESSHSQMLRMINQGVALRPVRREELSLREKSTTLDFTSELQWKISKQKREKMEKSKELNDAQENDNQESSLKTLSDEIQNYIRHTSQCFIPRLRDIVKLISDSQSILVEAKLPEYRLLNEEYFSLKSLSDTLRWLEEASHFANNLYEKQTSIMKSSPVLIDFTAIHNWILTLQKRLQEIQAPVIQASIERFNVQMAEFLQVTGESVDKLLNLLYSKATISFEAISNEKVSKFDHNSKVASVYNQITTCKQLSQFFESSHVHLPLHPHFNEMDKYIDFLSNNFPEAIKIRNRHGEWDKKETVKLSSTEKPIVPGKSYHDFKNQASEAIQSRLLPKLQELLTEAHLSANWIENRAYLVRTAIFCKYIEAIQYVVSEQVNKSVEITSSDKLQWLVESIKKGYLEGVEFFMDLGANVNGRTNDSGKTPLHYAAAGRSDFKIISFLLEKGADPSAFNSNSSTPLQLLAAKFPEEKIPKGHQGMNFEPFMNSNILSDLKVTTSDGLSFPAHKIVLAANSPVFFSMFSSNWLEGVSNELKLVDIDSRVYKYLAEYFYTSVCTIPLDDLNLAIELLSVCQRYILYGLISLIQDRLTDKVNDDCVIDLYHASYEVGASVLCCKCASHFLIRYNFINDSEKTKTLMHIVNNMSLSSTFN